jgi:hypothetical protein
MKSVLMIANLILAVAILIGGAMAADAQRASAESTGHWLMKEGVLRESPDLKIDDIDRTLRNSSSSGLMEFVGAVGAVACLANAAAIGIFWPKRESS